MHDDAVILRFPDASNAESNRLAGNLAEALLDTEPGVSVERLRELPDTQDFGATLAVALGTAAVTSVAKGLAAWLARNSGVRIDIVRNGEVIMSATNLDSKDVPRLAEAISTRK